MYTRYQQHRAALLDGLLSMASHAESALATATRAYVDRDDDAARAVEESEDVLDHYEVELDERALGILSMAPLAAELRLVAVAMRISQNLERVGDQAVVIARHAVARNCDAPLPPPVELIRMAAIAREMLHGAVDAFVERNPEQARRVIARDAEVNRLNQEVQREVSKHVVKEVANISHCLSRLEISRAIERIADHATNVAEQVVYLCGACDIRHSRSRHHEFERSRG